MNTIDLRSDTVTLPTQAMRDAVFHADLGDDVFGEDPTTARLEKMAAEMTGTEAALLVTSGTQGNIVSLLAHCRRGDEIIVGDQAHIIYYEAGGMAALGGIVPRTVTNLSDGTMDLDDIEKAIRDDNVHYPRTSLICLENTHNRCNGSPLSVEYTARVVTLAREYGLKVHLDGARVFNAAVALGVPVGDLVRGVDSVSFCLSKGLSAPVGSLLCGATEFIDDARRIRKMLGGGMRQSGIIAAAGIVALQEMTDRLAEDHRNARRLAEGIAEIPQLIVAPEQVRTNIVFFNLLSGTLSEEEFLSRAGERGLKFLHLGPLQFRMVTHAGITDGDVEEALRVLAGLFRVG